MHQAGREHGLRYRIHQATFNALYQRTLLYNQCWEDPAVDRLALDLDADSEIVMITSAGCNALDYLLYQDGPRRIHCVDANPRQTALLELKLAGIRKLSWDDFFSLFGLGRHPDIKKIYKRVLRSEISEESQAIWDKNLNWWKPGPVRRGFYDHGLSGIFARGAIAYIRSRPGLFEAIQDVIHAPDMDAQRRLWDTEVKKRLFSKPLRWTLERQATMNLLGVPYEQLRQTGDSHGDGMAAFVEDAVGRVARNLPARENYFYRVYLEGQYTRDVCPEYLKEQNFETLRERVDRMRFETTTLTEYFRSGAARPTHLILLDHMDWMGTAFPQALVAEWEAMLEVSAPGARVIFRSGEAQPGFLDEVKLRGLPLREHADWHIERAQELHELDRVGTYASFWIGDLRNEN